MLNKEAVCLCIFSDELLSFERQIMKDLKVSLNWVAGICRSMCLTYAMAEVTNCKQADIDFRGQEEIYFESGGVMDYEEDRSRPKRYFLTPNSSLVKNYNRALKCLVNEDIIHIHYHHLHFGLGSCVGWQLLPMSRYMTWDEGLITWLLRSKLAFV